MFFAKTIFLKPCYEYMYRYTRRLPEHASPCAQKQSNQFSMTVLRSRVQRWLTFAVDVIDCVVIGCRRTLFKKLVTRVVASVSEIIFMVSFNGCLCLSVWLSVCVWLYVYPSVCLSSGFFLPSICVIVYIAPSYVLSTLPGSKMQWWLFIVVFSIEDGPKTNEISNSPQLTILGGVM